MSLEWISPWRGGSVCIEGSGLGGWVGEGSPSAGDLVAGRRHQMAVGLQTLVGYGELPALYLLALSTAIVSLMETGAGRKENRKRRGGSVHVAAEADDGLRGASTAARSRIDHSRPASRILAMWRDDDA